MYRDVTTVEILESSRAQCFSKQCVISRRGTLNILTVAGHRLYVPSTSAIGVKDSGSPCDSETPLVSSFCIKVEQELVSVSVSLFFSLALALLECSV